MLNDYRVKGLATPDMEEADFLARIVERNLAIPVGEARAVYSYAVSRQVSQAWVLAVFQHESQMGKVGTATRTHSWGNTRRPSFGVPDIGEVAGRSGKFSQYANWADGGVSTVARICDHSAYRAASTVREITPIWAPPTDLNDTQGYIKAVLADIERWAHPQEQTSMVTIREAIIPAENVKSNRPGTKLQGAKPSFITIHETANTAAGANAEMHRRFTHGANGWGGGGHPATATEPEYEGVSFHYVVDDKEAVHLLPDDEIGYHAGDGLGWNSGGATSLGIETCVNSDGNFPQALANLAQLVAILMQRHGIPLANVVQHNHWSGKDCPHKLRAAGWAGLVAAIAAASKVPPPLPTNDPSVRLMAAYRALPDYLRGVETHEVFYEFGVDLGGLNAPAPKGHGLHSEYVTLWTALGLPIYAMQPELMIRLVGAGKVTVY